MQDKTHLYIAPKKTDFSKEKSVLWLNVKQNEPAQHIHHIDTYIESALRPQFNVLKFIINGEPNENEWRLNKGFLESLSRKAADSNYIEKNKEKIFKQLDETFKDIHYIDYCFINFDFIYLPLNPYVSAKESKKLNEAANEFFDYTKPISDSEKKLIDKTNEKVLKEFYRYVSMFAFSTSLTAMTFLVHEYMSIKKKCGQFFVFCIDPDGYWPKWMQYGNTKFLYFTEDKRGSRHMDGFEIAQINHLTNTTIKENCDPDKKESFVWIGTLFNRKGTRSTVYDTYIKDLNGLDYSFYCPLTLDSINKKENDRNKALTKDAFSDLYESVINNKHYKGSCKTYEVDDIMAEHKYSLITRCRSVYDSLNFRPVLYAKHGVLPFLDPQFDPDCLIYPKEMQAKLLVYSAKDIKDRIAYFDAHDDERKEMLLKIRRMLRVDEYMKDSDAAARKAIHSIIPEFKP